MSKKVNFESSLEQLEGIVKKLEKPDVNLQESLKLFESGVKLYKDCQKSIDEAEKKIKILTDMLDEEDY